MPWWVILALVIAVVGSNYSWYEAMRRLSATGKERRWRIYFWSNLLAGRENFTEDGWRYRNIAWLFVLAWPVIAFVWMAKG